MTFYLRAAALFVSALLIQLTLVWPPVAFAQGVPLTIPQIQGASHISPRVGEAVETTGIVTALDDIGFYIQDAVGDGDPATSDAIFVFTDFPPGVAVGDRLRVEGVVSEFMSGRLNLPKTQLVSPFVSLLSSGNALPAATVLGAGGRAQPTAVIEDDSFGSFDPAADGIDFYESLEGMLVEVPSAIAVDTTTGFGEIWAVPETVNGAAPTGFNSRGGVTISPGDFNPERLQLDDRLGIGLPLVEVGDKLTGVTGVVDYAFGDYELLLTQAPVLVGGGGARETSGLRGSKNRLTVASYNVLNLDPFDGPNKFNALAGDIANGLNSPDIVALQEIQDSDGPGLDFRLDADATAAALIAAIENAGGPTYEYVDVPPPNANIDGGEPTGNIRVGYLYNPARVDLVPGSLQRFGEAEPEFLGSRKPLQVTFEFNGQQVTLINNHFRAKGGSTGLFENIQPFINGGADTRESQAEFVAGLVADLLAGDPDANVIVLGDLNEFSFESPLDALLREGLPLTNLEELLDPTDRYTFIFEGNSQSLDHLLVTEGLLAGAQFDAVHLNTGLLGAASDHDPLLASFVIGVPEPSCFMLEALAMGTTALPRTRRKA
ncbi:MAG: endonuclease/exonuclease/phosphatase family protein [Planctomycetota bacterium]